MQLPRGIRNNNPGNIRKSSANWVGKIEDGTDSSFEQFDNPINGLRALMKILCSYYKKYGLDTVRSIINRWAPPNENDTSSYVIGVADRMGVGPDVKLPVRDIPDLMNLAIAIVLHENGRPPFDSGYSENWYSDNMYLIAAKKALGKSDDNERLSA